MFDILRGDSDPSSPRMLTQEARMSLPKVEQAISEQNIGYFSPELPLQFLVFPTPFSPTGLLWQLKPLFWVHMSASPSKVLPTYPQLVANVLCLDREAALKPLAEIQMLLF